MKRITIDINDAEYQRLKLFAEYREISVSKLLGAFVQDLTASERSGGSDERMHAQSWLDRSGVKYR